MAEKQRFRRSNTKLKCKDKNIPENVKALEKHCGISRWQRLIHQCQYIQTTHFK